MKYYNVMKQKLAENFMNFMYMFKTTRKILRKMLMRMRIYTPGEALFIHDQLEQLNYLDYLNHLKHSKKNGKV